MALKEIDRRMWNWLYYDPLPPSLFLLSILGSCAIMHFAANWQILLLLLMMMLVHRQLHSFGQPMCWSLSGYPGSTTRRWSPSRNCRQNYSSVCFDVLVLKYWM